MNAISIAKLYNQLTAKLGNETAENLTNFIENKINQELESKTHILATKEDIAKLASTTKENIAQLAIATKEDIRKLAVTTKEDIGFYRSDTIKWMFIFWVGQVAVTFGFILLFLRK